MPLAKLALPGRGFTMIETLIVLALATLIILIVLLAVPAMNRNFRNTSRRRDAEFIASQRLQYDLDYSASVNVPPGGYTCTAPLTNKAFCSYVISAMNFYSQDNIIFHSNGVTVPTIMPTVADANTVLTDSYLSCNSTGTGAIASHTAFDMVVLFAVETSRSGIQQQCLQSGIYSGD